jgi:hypothetical protein
VLADRAHLALTLDGRIHHQRVKPEFAQRHRGLFHLGGAPFAMARHAFQVVIGDLGEIEHRIIVFERGGHFFKQARARGSQEAFQCQRLHPLDHHAAYHLYRRRLTGVAWDD